MRRNGLATAHRARGLVMTTDAQKAAALERVVDALMGDFESAIDMAARVRRLKAEHGSRWVEAFELEGRA